MNPSRRFGSSCSALRRRAPAATMASADFSLRPACSLQAQCRRRPFRRKTRPPRVRRVTFAPSTRRIYVHSVRVAIGLQVALPPRPPGGRLLCGSCSSGQSFAFSFLPAAPHETTLAVRLGVPSHLGPQGTPTPKSLPVRLSPHGYIPRLRGNAPCLAHQAKGAGAEAPAPDCFALRRQLARRPVFSLRRWARRRVAARTEPEDLPRPIRLA